MARKKSKKKSKKTSYKIVNALFLRGEIITEISPEAKEFYDQSRLGDLKKTGKVHLSLIEGLFLIEKKRLNVFDGRQHLLTEEEYLRKSVKQQPKFLIRYAVFKDLRERGYIVKTALKFGADFRVYDRGIKPGEDHAKWVVFPVHEGSVLTWQDFAAKNRVAHSTKKRLLLGVVDDEGDVSYWECRWIRP